MATSRIEAQQDHTSHDTKKLNWWRVGVSISVFVSTVLPLLLFLRRFPRFAPFAAFANDAFYYLTVARNSLHTSFYSFDGTYPTNGFHPVWQLLFYTAMRWNVLKPADPMVTLHRLFIQKRAFARRRGFHASGLLTHHFHRTWLAFPAVCPGFLWFAVALVAPVYLLQLVVSQWHGNFCRTRLP